MANVEADSVTLRTPTGITHFMGHEGANPGSDSSLFGKYLASTVTNVVYGADPSNTASANTTAINAALTNGGLVELIGTGVVEIDATLIFPDNTALHIPAGLTIKAGGTTKFSMMENSAWSTRAVGAGGGLGSGSNTNIAVFGGGTIDANTAAMSGGTQFDLMITRWSNIDNFTFDISVIDSNKGGGKYSVMLHMCSNVDVTIPTIDCDSDGVHITSGGDNIRVHGIDGSCGDDMLAILIGDFEVYIVNDQYSNITNVSWGTINGSNTDLAMVKLGGGMPFGNEGTFTAVAGTDIITSTSHGLSDDDTISTNSTTTLPAGLSPNRQYYVITSTTNTFQLSDFLGGSAIDITDTGTGTHSWGRQYIFDNINGGNITGTCDNTPIKIVENVDAGVTANIEGMIGGNIDMGSIYLDKAPTGDRYFQIVTDSNSITTYLIDTLKIDTPKAFAISSKYFFRVNAGNAPTINTLIISGLVEGDGSGFLLNADDSVIIDVLDLRGLVMRDMGNAINTTTGGTVNNMFLQGFQFYDSIRLAFIRFACNIFVEGFIHNGMATGKPLNINTNGVEVNIHGKDIIGVDDSGTVDTDIAKTTHIHGGASIDLDDITPFTNGYALNTKGSITTTPGTGDKLGYYLCSNGSDWVHITSGETF